MGRFDHIPRDLLRSIKDGKNAFGGGKGGGGGGGQGPQANIPYQQIASLEQAYGQLANYESSFLNFAPAEANFGFNVATGGGVPSLPTNLGGNLPPGSTNIAMNNILPLGGGAPGTGGVGGGGGTWGGGWGGGGGFGGGGTAVGGGGGGLGPNPLSAATDPWTSSLGPLFGAEAGNLGQAAQAITGGNAPGVTTLGPVNLPGGVQGTLLQNSQGQEVAVTPGGQYFGINPDGTTTPYSLQQVQAFGFLSGTGLPAQQAATLAETQGLQAEQKQLYGQGQNLFQMATTGTGLFPSQQAFVTQATQAEQAGLQQQMANAGLSASTQNQILQGEAAQQGAATAGQLIQGNIAAAQQQIQLSNTAAQLVLEGQSLSLQQENALVSQFSQLAQLDQSMQAQGWTEAMQGQGAMKDMLQNVLGPFNASANMVALQVESQLQNAQIAAQFEAAQNQAAASSSSSLFSGLLGPLLGGGGQGGGGLGGLLGGLGGLLGGGGAAAGLGGALGGSAAAGSIGSLAALGAGLAFL